MRWLSILVVAVALVAAGCGGGNDESAASTETTTEETTTTSDTTTSDETATDGSTDTTDLSGILGDEDCLALASVGATMAQAFAGASGSTDNSAELENLASKVPDEIKADVQVLAQAFATYSAKLKDVGVEAGKTPTADQLQQLQAAIASLDQQELTAASQRIEAWSKKNCSG
jgi:hypothetical protein